MSLTSARVWAFLILTLSMVPMASAVKLAYVSFGAGGSACCLVPDGHGNIYVVGSAGDELGANVLVTKLDAAGHVGAGFRFGGSLDRPIAAALDPAGNLVVAGQTQSSDFPLVNPVIA